MNTEESKVGVVLVHGLTGTPVEMRALEKFLRKRGFEVENVLLAGHGAGHKEMLASTWQQWLESARDGVAKISRSCDRVILCGLSMGAIICGVLASEKHPAVCGVVMMSPTLSYDGSIMFNKAFDTFVHNKAVQDSMRCLVGRFPWIGQQIFWEETPPYGVKDQRLQRQITKSIEAARQGGGSDFGTFRTYYGSLWQMWALVDYALPRFADVDVPVLLVSSLEDSLASIHNATRTYCAIGATNKQMLFLTGCDHVMTLDLQKHLLHSLIGSFVEAYGADGSAGAVREVTLPALSAGPYSKDNTMTISLTAEACGLSVQEWETIYPEQAFGAVSERVAPTVAAVQHHALVAREAGAAVLNIPVQLTRYCALPSLSDARPLPWLRPLTLAMGATSGNVPAIGVCERVHFNSYVSAWRHCLDIFQSMARTHEVEMTTYEGLSQKAYRQVQTAQNPRTGTRRLLSPERIDTPAAKKSTVSHRNPFIGWCLNRLSDQVRCVPEHQTNTSSSLDEVAIA